MTHHASSTLFGHPKGLLFLAFTEAWERFSFYGMSALLVLYMLNRLLLPEHVSQIGGFAQYRAALEWIFGPLSTQALASQTFGLYSGFIYFTPILGGLIADRWLGQRLAVVVGALAMSAGHLAMTFDRTFLLALVLLIVGSGFLKGNISAQVGALYPPEDEARRTRGFVIFSTGINVGAVVGPILCGLIAELYGWHAGFGLAAGLMLIGLATYLYGYRYLPAKPKQSARQHDALSPADWRSIIALGMVIAITIFQTVSYLQIANVLPVWIQDHVYLTVGSFEIPIAWYQSIDSFVSILFVPVLLWLWRHQASRRGAPDDLAKIGTGAWITAASNLVLVVAIFQSGGQRVSAMWPFVQCVGMGIGFLYYWPTLLALVSRAAPAKVNSTMMGVAMMSLFFGNVLIGWIGAFYERMTPIQFWELHALIGAGGGVVVLVFGRRLSRILHEGVAA